MDKFVKQFRQELHDNPDARNHLVNSQNTNSKKRKNKKLISAYFKVENNPNTISIDCSSDENEDEDMEIMDEELHKRNMNKKQKLLRFFMKPSDEINAQNERREIEKQHAKYDYLYVSPLMNQRHLFELTELTGLRNRGSAHRLSRICSQNVYNLHSDILYRRNLYMIINNENLHRLPMRHSFEDNDTHYISSIKFDKMGSLFCAASTNGKLGIFDFDDLQTKWNQKARIRYNKHMMQLQKQNENTDIVDIKQYAYGSNAASMENVMEICIDTQFRIEDIEWSHNMNDIAVCGHSGGCLNIYDLRRANNKPKHKLKSSTRHHPLLNIKYSPTQSTLISSGDRMGNVYVWDLKKKTSSPAVHFDALSRSKQTSFTGNTIARNANVSGMNMSHFAVKHISISSDGVLLYVVRENGFIQIMDIRKPGHVYKTIDLWRCSFLDENKEKNKNKDTFYEESMGRNHRARIDDAKILHSMNIALLKLQNNSLVNVHLETETIRKTFAGAFNFKQLPPNEQAINIAFLSKVRQRRMCSFENYAMPEIVISGSFDKEMVVMDLSTDMDAHCAEREYKKKRMDLGFLEDSTNAGNDFKKDLHHTSYGFMGYCELSEILTSCSLHPKSLYTVCGTLHNCLEIVACSSNPF